MSFSVFVIMGTSGEYEDREQWVVCAVRSDELAEQYVEAAQSEFHACHAEYKELREATQERWMADETGTVKAPWEEFKWPGLLDPALSDREGHEKWTSGDVHYWNEEVKLLRSMPKQRNRSRRKRP